MTMMTMLAMMRGTAVRQALGWPRFCCRHLSTQGRVSNGENQCGGFDVKKQRVAERASKFEETVWVEFTPLAQKHGAVNLSQVSEDELCVCVCVSVCLCLCLLALAR